MEMLDEGLNALWIKLFLFSKKTGPGRTVTLHTGFFFGFEPERSSV
jgi:hypothetical protein